MSDNEKQPATPGPAAISPPPVVIMPPRPPVIAEFQSDAVELEERTPPRIARLALFGVTGLIAAFVAWACLSKVDEVVVAQGKLITTKPTIIVQPLETSIIRSIDVTAGDVVRAGQQLATLDSTFTESDLEQRRAELAALNAYVQRLEAELSGSDFKPAPDAASDGQLQRQIFGQRRAYTTAMLVNFDQQIAGQGALMESAIGQRTVLESRRAALREIEAGRELLAKRETGSRMNMLTSRDARLAIDVNLAQTEGSESAARHTIAKLRADRQAFIEDFRRTAMEELVEKRSRRDTVAQELRKMQLRQRMVVLTAPADGVVLDMAQRSIGSVVREAEPVATLVPLNVPLEAEVTIAANDIGRIRQGGAARVKFDAYPFQKYGTAQATLRTISQDAYLPDAQQGAGAPGKQPYFKARVSLGETGATQNFDRLKLLPGMAVTVELKVGQRRIISYLLYPIIRTLDESIREP